ncbi:flavin-binding monooxygenase [Penicillium hordei]|uniref:Flavin-binding monooxygenase n=1 Tax=Penicillium hordei TaxID=40994 RepID=A0AAD6ED93_9EURO|nr:flavin-binding monooxygenase [Penicillium hordei]KAJ5608275.1 flavin-binding monooxygenase [Penicillium hordei]
MEDCNNSLPNDHYYPVIIIGAGISGIASACQLQRKFGCNQFMIFESQDGIGGTWWNHRYPGVATDSPSPLYSYSFAPLPSFAGPRATGKEMYQYLHTVCTQHGILNRIQLSTDVTDLIWDDSEKQWIASIVTAKKRTRVRAKIVISAVGKFGSPDISMLQSILGIDTFRGRIMHTAQWDSSVTLRGKDITVIGAGCSAAQLVPKLLASSEIQPRSVTQIIRSPHWVTPDPYSGELRRFWNLCMPVIVSCRLGAWMARSVLFILYELFYFLFYRPFSNRSQFQKRFQRRLTSYIDRKVPEEYKSMLTPRYTVGCKRVILDPGWYDTLKDPRFSLHVSRLKRFEENCLVLGTGKKETKVFTDVLLLATGYSPTSNFLSSISMTGRDGIDLQKIWNARGGPQAYLGLAMDQFPNLFFISGPNSSVSHGSVMAGIENSVCYIMQLLGPVLEGQVASLEVKKDACCTWTQKVQLASKDSIWVKGGCSNWYIDGRGWNSMIYPYVPIHCCIQRSQF